MKYHIKVGKKLWKLDATVEATATSGDGKELSNLLVDLDRTDGEKCRVLGAEKVKDHYEGGQFPEVVLQQNRIGVKVKKVKVKVKKGK